MGFFMTKKDQNFLLKFNKNKISTLPIFVLQILYIEAPSPEARLTATPCKQLTTVVHVDDPVNP